MASHTSVLFQGFSGSIDRQLLFRQCGGKTVVSMFPDRGSVIYSEKQKQERRRFADAVSFARVVIADQGLQQVYSIKAALLGFRSAWNVAIAEYMSNGLLKAKKKKIPFNRSLIKYPAGSKIHIKLFKTIAREPRVLIKVSRRKSRSRDIAKYRQDRARVGLNGWTAPTVSSR